MTLDQAIQIWNRRGATEQDRAAVIGQLKDDLALLASAMDEHDRIAGAGPRNLLDPSHMDHIGRVRHRILSEMLAAMKETV